VEALRERGKPDDIVFSRMGFTKANNSGAQTIIACQISAHLVRSPHLSRSTLHT
jgi:hypothetical protein